MRTSRPSARSVSGSPSSPDGLSLKVVLASGSPQRREILQKLGVEFEVVVPGVEELADGDPEFLVAENARRKARAGWRAGLVIACDTDVVLDGEVLGKPGDEAEAREYLDRMSGKAHTVMSGLVVIEDGEERSGLEKTKVVFKDLTDVEKDRYVRFGEWRNRSGGYAIQTLGSTLVERLEGSVSNVVGLPVGLLAELAPTLFDNQF
ncbi:MAG TPA: nucleoside triphosphate pyrophosphatase [Solirubrobacterales bacterium]|nr:nucleoside triphosphate pyrophosphatase [Solirubrobacterales bacterium]